MFYISPMSIASSSVIDQSRTTKPYDIAGVAYVLIASVVLLLFKLVFRTFLTRTEYSSRIDFFISAVLMVDGVVIGDGGWRYYYYHYYYYFSRSQKYKRYETKT